MTATNGLSIIGDRFNSPSRSEISRSGLAFLQVVCVSPRDPRGCAEAPACARGMARARLAPVPDPSPGPGQTFPDPGMYPWWSSMAQGTPLVHRGLGMTRRAGAGGPRAVVGRQLTHTTYYAYYRSMGGRPPWQPLCPAPHLPLSHSPLFTTPPVLRCSSLPRNYFKSKAGFRRPPRTFHLPRPSLCFLPLVQHSRVVSLKTAGIPPRGNPRQPHPQRIGLGYGA